MLCPYCHAENRDDALTCDFCMHPIPMTEDRMKNIKKNSKIAKKNKLHNSMIKIIGLSLGLLAIIAVVVIAWLTTRG